MAFFTRELSPVERFESALKSKGRERESLAGRLSLVETTLAEERGLAERLAVAGASNAKLERADAKLRAVEDRARTLRAALAELDHQIAATERALADAIAQRDRELQADKIEELASAIEQAVPGFMAGAAALVDAAANGAVAVAQATSFAGSVDAVRREVRSAADLVCWELRTLAVRTRAGNTNVALSAPPQGDEVRVPDVERQSVFTLNPVLWREGSKVKKAPAFALVELPKGLVAAALQHQHVDYLNARRVQTLMHVHGSGEVQIDAAPAEAECVDLDALAADEQASANVNVA
jgi:hypothetical protein